MSQRRKENVKLALANLPVHQISSKILKANLNQLNPLRSDLVGKDCGLEIEAAWKREKIVD